MSKKIVGTLLIVIFVIINTVCFAQTKDYKVIIEDDANLLTQSEKAMLENEMIKLTEYGNILFKTIDTNEYYSTAKYASVYYHSMCGTQSGTVFLIDMGLRKIYIFSDGKNYGTITNAKAETITDNIYRYATNKQYYECASQAYSQILTVLEGGKIAEPMKYISNGFIAIMIALFINFFIFKKASESKKVASKELIEECERYFEHTEPRITKTGNHREYSPVESSSGGGSSGGGRWTVGGGRKQPEVGGGHSF